MSLFWGNAQGQPLPSAFQHSGASGEGAPTSFHPGDHVMCAMACGDIRAHTRGIVVAVREGACEVRFGGASIQLVANDVLIKIGMQAFEVPGDGRLPKHRSTSDIPSSELHLRQRAQPCIAKGACSGLSGEGSRRGFYSTGPHPSTRVGTWPQHPPPPSTEIYPGPIAALDHGHGSLLGSQMLVAPPLYGSVNHYPSNTFHVGPYPFGNHVAGIPQYADPENGCWHGGDQMKRGQAGPVRAQVNVWGENCPNAGPVWGLPSPGHMAPSREHRTGGPK